MPTVTGEADVKLVSAGASSMPCVESGLWGATFEGLRAHMPSTMLPLKQQLPATRSVRNVAADIGVWGSAPTRMHACMHSAARVGTTSAIPILTLE